MGKVEPGKRFEGWLKDSFDAVGVYAMRIPDKVVWTGRQMVGEQTPADFSAYHVNGAGTLHCFLVEAKACSKHRIPFNNLQEHQSKALLDFEAMHEDAHGYVALNFYDSVNVRRLNVCFMVPISVWVEYETREGAMKSLSHEECTDDDRIILCPRDGQVFDMSRWLGGFES